MQKILFTPQIYIFGAKSRGKTLMGCLRFLYPQTRILAFLVDCMDENEGQIDGIPVRVPDAAEALDCRCSVFIATKGICHQDIKRRLEERGMKDIIPVTAEVDNFFRNEYVKRRYVKERRDFTKIEDLSVREVSAAVYMAESIYDRPLKTTYTPPCYEKAVQAGAALTAERLSADILTDCTGENISEKNRQYCELTVLYWIWKNAAEDIVGLSHYRRHFLLPDNWKEKMSTNGVDAILPVPTYVYPSVEANYRERHDPADWEYLMEYLRENNPDDYRDAVRVFAGNLYLPCNMFILRRTVLDGLCRWMFPILDAAVRHGGEKPDAYRNRYPGFLSERLITLYFYRNRDRYGIVYADRNFVE